MYQRCGKGIVACYFVSHFIVEAVLVLCTSVYNTKDILLLCQLS